ncbi:MAG TPA: SH3 domain-containing protein, partial [Patescibacteria group bacterium]|nr:SH3 domain-containing protein [Patescibacteria group bacterium]
YRQLLNQGFTSEAIHYNLGNALFKMGEIGPAILEFEKAASIAPNDPDLIANLEFVRTLTADKTTEAGAQTTAFFVERLLSLTTIDQDAVIFCVLYLVMGLLVGLRIGMSGALPRRIALWGMATLALPLALSAGSFGVKLYRSATTTHAIVLAERLDVRSGPGDENTTLFTVHEGLKLRVRNQQGSWFQVSLDNGLNGWVPASSLGII